MSEPGALLVALAARLREQRERLKVEKANEERIERELSARMLAAQVMTIQIDGDWRAVRDEPVTRTVDYDRFVEACRECQLTEAETAACLKRSVDLRKARDLLADLVPFDSICDSKPQGPRIRIVRGQED